MITALRAAAISALLAIILVTATLLIADQRDGPEVDVSVLDEAPIAVSVEGAVASPGVYELPSNARLNDAISAAGGLTSGADPSGLNLAARVGDGERIVIATRVSLAVATPAASSATLARININTATAAELDRLPGIGEVLAARIVAYRDKHGPFTSVDQLVEIEGISANTVANLRDLVTVGE